MAEAQSIYDRVTNKIVADLEQGVRSWARPWTGGNPDGFSRPLRWEGTPYSGINVLILWEQQIDKGYDSPYWMTFNQAMQLGGCVRKGEKATQVVYANKIVRQDEADAEKTKRISFLKTYNVFSANQCESLPAKYQLQVVSLPKAERVDIAEQFVQAAGALVRHGGNNAYYSRSTDHIQMPHREVFNDKESYVATVCHELTHWTGNEKRLNREFGKRFGDEKYSAEELVAELGAAFLCADLQITPEVRDDHAQYIGHWLRILKGDSRAIFTAASAASKAAEYLHGLGQPTRPGQSPRPQTLGVEP